MLDINYQNFTNDHNAEACFLIIGNLRLGP